jgi:hypothetical protein
MVNNNVEDGVITLRWPQRHARFSCSQSKLPGYILPSLPPITILTGDC